MTPLRNVFAAALTALALGCSGGAVDTSPASSTTAEFRAEVRANPVVGYVTSWSIYERGFRIRDLATSGAAERLGVVDYAFATLQGGRCVAANERGVGDAWADYQVRFPAHESVDGVADARGEALAGNFHQLAKLKKRFPHLRVVVSLGGAKGSAALRAAAATPAGRAELVRSCIDVYVRGNLPVLPDDPHGGAGAAAGVFDGFDLDWEYPEAAEAEHFTELLAEMRRQLDAEGRELLLTAALPTHPDRLRVLDLAGAARSVDWFGLMAYDLHGSWEPRGPVAYHAPLRGEDGAAEAAVHVLRDAGVPGSKLVLGAAAYGRGWTNVPSGSVAPLGATGPSVRVAPGSSEPGVLTYRELRARNVEARYDGEAGASYAFDGTTFWSFDDPRSLAEKMKFVRANGLRGAMLWALDGDTDDGELVRAVAGGL